MNIISFFAGKRQRDPTPRCGSTTEDTDGRYYRAQRGKLEQYTKLFGDDSPITREQRRHVDALRRQLAARNAA